MAAKELGTKHTCFKCGTKFYDFGKPEPICPKCGADQRESPALKAPPASERRRAPKPAPVVAEAPAVEEEGEGEGSPAEEEDEDEPAEPEDDE